VFTLCDPKERIIHKATVRDRIVHHALFTILNPVFEPTFITNSFSCRIGKGTHKAVNALEKMLRSVSQNNHKPCFVLKCDIHQFFASVNHSILLQIVKKRLKDGKVMTLLSQIIKSFVVQRNHAAVVTPELIRGLPSGYSGIPIGNLTSQLFANIYMNEFDQWIEQTLLVKHYARYTDDFVIVAETKEELERLLLSIQSFLAEHLQLKLHPHKVTIRKYSQGIDFLGYILLPHHRTLRTTTRRRIRRKMDECIEQYNKGLIGVESIEQSLQSYLGVLSHAHCYRLSQSIQNHCWFGIQNRG
jgi:retron-type reverse transcriptase